MLSTSHPNHHCRTKLNENTFSVHSNLFFEGNIASGPDEYSGMALQDGCFLPTLATCFQSSHRHIRKESLWVMSNLTAGPAEHSRAVMSQANITPIIVHMLISETYDLKREVSYVVLQSCLFVLERNYSQCKR